jgi:large subunit ribosomal protein L23
MRHYADVILRPLVSEKGMHIIDTRNQYPFEVTMDANKIEIKQAIETRWGVRVLRVNTLVVRGKARSRRWWQQGRRKNWKKAVVTLHKDDVIEFI